MALAKISAPSPAAPWERVKYLFTFRNLVSLPYSVALHDHNVWQIDYCLKGAMHLELAAGWREVPAGSYVLIPPGVRHGFAYREVGVEFLAFRFDAETTSTWTSVALGGTDATERVLAELMNQAEQTPMLAGEKRRLVLESAFAGLLAYHFAPAETSVGGTLRRQVEELLHARGGRRITVTEVARRCGYSERHAAALYQRETGHSLKSAIDQHRAEAAERFLRYADLSISQIAEALEFTDVFSFSRFFKRQTGRSPRAARTEKT